MDAMGTPSPQMIGRAQPPAASLPGKSANAPEAEQPRRSSPLAAALSTSPHQGEALARNSCDAGAPPAVKAAAAAAPTAAAAAPRWQPPAEAEAAKRLLASMQQQPQPQAQPPNTNHTCKRSRRDRTIHSNTCTSSSRSRSRDILIMRSSRRHLQAHCGISPRPKRLIPRLIELTRRFPRRLHR